MAPAAAAMQAALADTAISAPCVPLVANVTAEPVTDPADIRKLLVEQVTGRVRWRESMIWMANAGITDLIEVGAGKVLTGLAKRNDERLQAISLSSLDAVKGFIETL